MQVLLFICLCYQNLWITYGATLSPLRISHPVKSQQRNNEYLPPYTTETEFIGEFELKFRVQKIGKCLVKLKK